MMLTEDEQDRDVAAVEGADGGAFDAYAPQVGEGAEGGDDRAGYG